MKSIYTTIDPLNNRLPIGKGSGKEQRIKLNINDNGVLKQVLSVDCIKQDDGSYKMIIAVFDRDGKRIDSNEYIV